MRKAYLTAALLGAALTAAFATPAQASSTAVAYTVADKDGSVVVYKAATGKANRIVVASGPTHYISIDDKFPIKAGHGCKAVKGDRTKVLCGVGELTERVRVSTFDRNDSITNKTRLKLIAYAGSGNDTVRGATAGDLIYGESGADTVYGNGGNDKVYGGSGNDTIYGGAGNDHLIGGSGKDKLRGGSGTDRIVA
ncbi:calcium-binding protein [Actinoplanes solisilvae]|uniref:calcium-binding protein n=1 Tax=Actinoplanes solisilvae TaxID=2486853 RepID=UPI000FD78772|nr:calcium-binding protein [Actinoplanes solisilvae]